MPETKNIEIVEKKIATKNDSNSVVKIKLLENLKGLSVLDAEDVLYEVGRLIKKNTVI